MSHREKVISRQEAGAFGRRAGRFAVPGATVSFHLGNKEQNEFDPAAQETCPVADLSTSGISFLTDMFIAPGPISLRFTYLDREDPIGLEGKVIYSVPHGAGLTYRYRVGVEFHPFSKQKQHNSLDALEALKRLEASFGAPWGSRI